MANTTAYGFVGLEHLFGTRVSDVNVARVWTAIQETAAEHNRAINALLSTIAEATETAQEQVELVGDGTLQPLDENGVPLPVKPSGSYQVAYPISGGGTAFGANRVASRLMTLNEVNRAVVDAQRRDGVWLRTRALAALFTNTTWTFDDKVGANGAGGLGNITIQPLANGDAVTYLRVGGSVAADSHYLAQAAAIADGTNPFPVIYDELMEHPSNAGGPVVAYIASDLVAATESLATFVPVSDPDVMTGNATDKLIATGDRGPGDEVLGKVGRTWVVEWRALPATYIIGHALGGGPVLKMREYPSPDLKGFFAEEFSPDGARTETRMIRFAGFGVSNRVGAVCYRIGNASYAIPSGYDASALP